MRMADDDRERSAREHRADRRGACHPGLRRPRRDRRRDLGRARRRPAVGDALRVDGLPARAARIGERRRRRPAGRRTSSPSSAPARSSPRARSTSRTTPTASTSSTGPGPTPTGATASTTTRSCSTRSRSRRCPGRACWRATPEHRLLLLRAIEQLARSARLSSAHLLFLDEDDQAAARAGGLVVAHAPCSSTGATATPTPYADFADFLASLQRDKRKKIQQERRRVADAGVDLHGRDAATQIAEADWDFFYRCYTLTYRAHHSTPYLTRDFFARIGGDDGAQLAALHRLARRQARSPRR